MCSGAGIIGYFADPEGHIWEVAHNPFCPLGRRAVSAGTVRLMRQPRSMWSLETFGRVRLSKHFYMRDFLYSEIGSFHGVPNLPRDPDLTIETGRALCTELLDPLEETFGRLAIRSGYRSAQLNQFGNENRLNCARNDNPLECHIWDRDQAMQPSPAHLWSSRGLRISMTAAATGRTLAWWVHDHLAYSEMWFFPKLAAFNLTWRPTPLRTISSYIAPRGMLLRAGQQPHETLTQRQSRYDDFPTFRGIRYP